MHLKFHFCSPINGIIKLFNYLQDVKMVPRFLKRRFWSTTYTSHIHEVHADETKLLLSHPLFWCTLHLVMEMKFRHVISRQSCDVGKSSEFVCQSNKLVPPLVWRRALIFILRSTRMKGEKTWRNSQQHGTRRTNFYSRRQICIQATSA